MTTELIIWISFAFYGAFIILRYWKNIAVFDILAIAPLIMILVTLGTDAIPLSVGIGLLVLIHIWGYWKGIND